MPTYSYRCPNCGHEYEKLQKISDRTRAKCPECSTRGERVITGGAGLVFKGSGFYITDYKRAGESGKKEEGGKGGGGDSSAKSTPSKKERKGGGS